MNHGPFWFMDENLADKKTSFDDNLASLRAEVKKSVADDFGIPGYKFLRSWMKCLTVLRNSCAHHARIWNQKFPFAPKLPSKRMPCAWITELPTATKSLYPQLCCIAYWLNNIKKGNTFTSDLKKLLSKYPNVDPVAMGFPRNWKEEPLWK